MEWQPLRTYLINSDKKMKGKVEHAVPQDFDFQPLKFFPRQF